MSWTLESMPDISGKTIIITGANSGLGFETSRELARKGGTIIMACRNLDKANAAKQSIINKIPRADINVMQLNLSSQKSVAAFANEFKNNYEKLDILINNAGIMAVPYSKTEDGFENHFATNHLGHFALTGMLLDLLNATPGARIINVSSLAYFLGNMNFGNIMYEDGKGYGKWRAYGRSKMANLLFTYELQRRLALAGKSTISLAAHPGLARTNIMPAQSTNRFSKAMSTAFSYVFKPPIKGAMPILHAAVDADVSSGEYFGPGKKGLPAVVKSNKASHDMVVAKQLWETSEELTGVRYLN